MGLEGAKAAPWPPPPGGSFQTLGTDRGLMRRAYGPHSPCSLWPLRYGGNVGALTFKCVACEGRASVIEGRAARTWSGPRGTGVSTGGGGGSIEPYKNWGAGVWEKGSIDRTIHQLL